RQIAGEQGELTEGRRGIGGVEPLRMLGAGQPAGGQAVAEHGGRVVPIGVRGPQLGPRRVLGGPDIGRERTAIAGVSHGPIVAANDAKRDMSRNPYCRPAALQPGDPVGVALLAGSPAPPRRGNSCACLFSWSWIRWSPSAPGAGGR